jgi:hypothetical protein
MLTEITVAKLEKILPSLFMPQAIVGATIIAYWGIYKNKLSTLTDRTMERLSANMGKTPIPMIQVSAKDMIEKKAKWLEGTEATAEIDRLWSDLESLNKQNGRHKWCLCLTVIPFLGVTSNVIALVALPSEGVISIQSWLVVAPALAFVVSVIATLIFVLRVVWKL